MFSPRRVAPLLAVVIAACEGITQPTARPSAAALSSTAAPSTPLVYVTNIAARGIQVISTATNNVVATVPVNWPLQVAITPDGAFAYVTNFSPPSVKVIETATNSIAGTVTFTATPWGVAITPDGAFAYVAMPAASEVHVIETATNTVAATVTVGSQPQSLAVTPDGRFAYVTSFGSSSVSVIETATNTVAGTVDVAGESWGVTITPDGRFAYVTHLRQGRVSVIETATNTVVATVSGVSAAANQPAVTPDGTRVYVPNFIGGAGGVTVIETATNTVMTSIGTGNGPRGVAITPDGSFAYVTNTFSGTVSVIETATNTVVATLPVGGTPSTGPIGVAITPLPIIPVVIDIKPGGGPNSISCTNDNGVISVAILTTPDFDATTVDHTAVRFHGASETHIDKKTGLPRRHEEDVDGDGDIDLVFHFRLGDTGLDCAAAEGTLTGRTFDGQAIEGTDAVVMIGG